MEVSNNYQAMNQYQLQNKPDASIQPVPKQDPTYSNKEVYEASQGNLIRNDEGQITTTPQGETNINNAQSEAAAKTVAETQASQDAQRENAANVLAHKSNKSQVEIYLAVAKDGDDTTASIIESLRDVQKQNNAVEAYATYQENQNAPANNFARGLTG